MEWLTLWADVYGLQRIQSHLCCCLLRLLRLRTRAYVHLRKLLCHTRRAWGRITLGRRFIALLGTVRRLTVGWLYTRCL